MIHFKLDFRSPLPLHEQIRRELRFLIFSGTLSEGDQLPPIRQLAVSLNVNPNTVARVYREMEQEGILSTHPGRGSFVSGVPGDIRQDERDEQIRQESRHLLERARELGYDGRDLVRLLKEIIKELPDQGKENS